MTKEAELRLSRPIIRGAHRYAALQESKPVEREEVFTVTLTAAKVKGVPIGEQQFLIDLVFKPNDSALRFRAEETQLLLAYCAEAFKEIEEADICAEKQNNVEPYNTGSKMDEIYA